MNTPQQSSDEEKISRNERKAIKTRRKMAGIEQSWEPYGLAFSGGGIRSATFCLGLLRGLAKCRLLKRFDYLSTVSGGGYVGGMLGRLYSDKTSAKQVEEGLASPTSLLLWWLRNNGRYLIPAGMQDLTQALTQIARSFAFNFLLMSWLAILVCAPALIIASPINGFTDDFWMATTFLSANALWAGAIYWLTFNRYVYTIISVITLPIIFFYCFFMSSANPVLLMILLVLSALFWVCTCLTGSTARVRLELTHYLKYLSMLLITLLAIYGLGHLGWLLTNKHINLMFFTVELNYISAASVVSVLSVIGKLLQVVFTRKPVLNEKVREQKHKPGVATLGNIGGITLSIVFLILGTVGLASFCSQFSHRGSTDLDELLIFFIAAFVLFILTSLFRLMPTLLNLSSMHNLYRARLERAWVSVGNAPGYQQPDDNKCRFSTNPLETYNRENVVKINRVTETAPEDDVKLFEYHPHKYGGPIHLITCCINQTIDDRTGNYNADRKGIALTVSALGIERGTRFPKLGEYKSNERKALGEGLSQWLAISGAAVSTGLGSQTAPGIAFLCFIFGVRTGFWHPQPLTPDTPDNKNLLTRLRNCVGACFKATAYLGGEMFARFPGIESKVWYLTDGGHFENTAIYPLLKRKLPLIVAADCGADPEYIFDDMENLVRKAQIDYAANINFYDFIGTPPLAGFTSLEGVKSLSNSEPYLLARIEYKNGTVGALIVVKPHLIENLSLDTSSYGNRDTKFPQQTTVDQFFDEQQWEAYHQLGLQMGEGIDRSLLALALSYVRMHKVR